MEDETQIIQKVQHKSYSIGTCIVIAAIIISGTLMFTVRTKDGGGALSAKAMAKLENAVIPSKGVVLPAVWGDIGKQLIDNGTIDQKKIEALYDQREGLDDEMKQLFSGTGNGALTITKDNADVLLNLLWALGLANKNAILENGPMVDKQYGGDASKFASTGGWTLAAGSPMNHYSKHAMIALTPEQQALVEQISKNIYRPCCGNSVYFPDCNHGMAMLGLLQLMASQGVNETDMYEAALAANSYWFPDTYLTLAQYFNTKKIAWDKIGAKEVLGANFSSGAGFAEIKKQVAPVQQNNGGGGCGV